jgi:hypothetical protein
MQSELGYGATTSATIAVGIMYCTTTCKLSVLVRVSWGWATASPGSCAKAEEVAIEGRNEDAGRNGSGGIRRCLAF